MVPVGVFIGGSMQSTVTWYPLRKKKALRAKTKQRRVKKSTAAKSGFPYSVDLSDPTNCAVWKTDRNGNPTSLSYTLPGTENTRSGTKTSDYTGPKPKPMPYPPPQRSLRVTRNFARETLGQYVTMPSQQLVGVRGGFKTMTGQRNLDNYFPKPQDLVSPSDVTIKLLLKIKDQSVNLAQAFAERGQTTNLFAATARRLATAAFMLRKGNWVEASRHLGYDLTRGQRRRLANNAIVWSKDQRKLLANSWLELQYGWRPLVDDVFGSVQAIAKANMEGGLILSKSALVQPDPRVYSRQNIFIRYPALYGVNEWIDGVRTVSAKTRTKVWYRSRSNTLTSSLADVGITNPAVLVWELLPYSFVVDWFLPVGNWLNTFDATVGQEFLAGYTATEYQYRDTMTGRHGYRVVSSQTYTRTPLTGFPSAPIPSFKNPLGVEHVANATALLQLAFFRRHQDVVIK